VPANYKKRYVPRSPYHTCISLFLCIFADNVCSRLGSPTGLYDADGALLVEIPVQCSKGAPTEGVDAIVFGQACNLRVTDGETLTIIHWVHTSNRSDNCRYFLKKRKHQIERRELDMSALQQQIVDKMNELEDQYEDLDVDVVGNELTHLIAMRGKHKVELKDLQADLHVLFETRSICESVVLMLNELADVSFFKHTVRFSELKLVEPTVAILVKPTVEVLEEVVEAHSTILSDWQAEELDGQYLGALVEGHGSENNQLDNPMGLTVSGDCLFVADRDNHRVSVYDLEGRFVRTIGLGQGAGDGQLNSPFDVVVAGVHLFVVDKLNDRICVFYKDNGLYLRSIGCDRGELEGKLSYPQGVAVSSDDLHLYVADFGNHRVTVFDVDGEFVRYIGEYDRQLLFPKGVAVAGDLLFVIDDTCWVFVFHTDGSFVRKFGKEGTNTVPFDGPSCGVTVVGDRVFVVDLFNDCVSVHQLDGTYLRQFGDNISSNASSCSSGIQSSSLCGPT
jgi:DNA-binding beta-propeller fold protein YncE